MSTLRVDTITDEAGTGAVDFPNGLTGDGSALTGITPTTAGVLTATAGAGVGEVGTYAFLGTAGSNQALTSGTLYSGSSLAYAGVARINASWSATNNNDVYSIGGGSSPSGTWRCMGYSDYVTTNRWPATVFVRIS